MLTKAAPKKYYLLHNKLSWMIGSEMTDIGDRIKKLRMAERATIGEMSDAVGMSKAYLWSIENGTSANPSINILKKIAAFLNISVCAIIGDAGDDPMASDIEKLSPEDRKILKDLIRRLSQPDLRE